MNIWQWILYLGTPVGIVFLMRWIRHRQDEIDQVLDRDQNDKDGLLHALARIRGESPM